MTPPVWTFHTKPWRHYQCDGSRTTPGGLEVLSVTQALGVLDKSGPLVGWAVRLTYEGAWSVARNPRYKMPNAAWKFRKDVEKAGLDHRSSVSDAQDRGTATHQVLEDWINERKLPVMANYPQAWRGWIRALAAWLSAEQPEFLESELIVGSATHGFAGRRDTVCRVKDKTRGNALLDAKTSKRIYPSSHFRQLAAYELAGVEGGENATDAQGILRLAEDGSYEVGWLQDVAPLASFQRAFLNALTTCRDERAIEKCVKATTKGPVIAKGQR